MSEKINTLDVFFLVVLSSSIILVIVGLVGGLDGVTEKQASLTELKEVVKPYYVTAMDGSKVLIIPQLDNSFIFYRDKDDDGWADTEGKGFFLFDLSRRTEENTLPEKEISMESMKKKYS